MGISRMDIGSNASTVQVLKTTRDRLMKLKSQEEDNPILGEQARKLAAEDFVGRLLNMYEQLRKEVK
jgi:hypothetical protein